jgi:DNA polymerase type B, organellar and viral
MIKYQNYSNYKLPITINPLEYGKLIEQFDNKFIIQLNTNNVIVIKQIDNENYIKLFRKGDLMFEFKDTIISDNSFIRSISDQRFTFKDGKLISTEIVVHNKYIKIFVIKSTNSILTSKTTPLEKILKFLENTHVFKNYKAELFILFELFLIFLVYLICFVIFPEDNTVTSIATGGIIKLRRVKSKYSWESQTFRINNKVFTKILFENMFNRLWSQVGNKFTDHNHMFILFKIKYVNGEFATIGNLQRINNSDKDWYINWIINNMEFKSEYYNETQIESFIFSYGFKDGKIKNKTISKSNLTFQNYKNNKLVISFNPLDFGKVLNITTLDNETLFILQSEDNLIIKILTSENKNAIEIFKQANSIIKFTDIKLSENRFVRTIDNKKYYFENNLQVLFTKINKSKSISKLEKSKNLVNNFITLDIETYIKDNTLIPYCISIYEGERTYSYFISDFNDSQDLILTALKSIMIRKYNGFSVYIHNMAKFDIIFLLKHLVKLGDVKPIIHNGRIISINLNFGKDLEYRLQFKDSYLILLASLAKFTKGFGVETQKSVFPFLFVNEDNLNYIGKVPNFTDFGGKIKLSEYNEYTSNFNNDWNLNKEAIKYCIIDCISLYQVVFKFNELIFNLFGKNIHHYPTLPSLAFAIFRSNFMKNENIPQLSGKIAKDIRQGYTGGSVDVFIPVSKPGIKIKCYDVNSLYPFIMKTKKMPVGIPLYFEGDITKVEAFGFFYCKIIAPDNIKHPILQTHVRTNNGTRTISPIGTWYDMIFSEEMKNAINYGYKFEILWGYTFKQECVFEGYVNLLYSLRLEYPKSNPLNYIAKILMNSLYGRFGMDDNFANINIIHKDYYADFENKFFDNIIDKIDLENYILVRYNSNENIEDLENHNVSISIAAAVTAYARIHMSQFKNNPKINLYYTDTDSIYTDSDIDESLISDKILGKLKLEHICDKTIFLTPKVYCLKLDSGEIIYKAKGLKHEVNLTFEDFENLLVKDVLIEKTQTKWFINLSEGKFKLLNELNTLKVNEKKDF